jgi:hypothetical protein
MVNFLHKIALFVSCGRSEAPSQSSAGLVYATQRLRRDIGMQKPRRLGCLLSAPALQPSVSRRVLVCSCLLLLVCSSLSARLRVCVSACPRVCVSACLLVLVCFPARLLHPIGRNGPSRQQNSQLSPVVILADAESLGILGMQPLHPRSGANESGGVHKRPNGKRVCCTSAYHVLRKDTEKVYGALDQYATPSYQDPNPGDISGVHCSEGVEDDGMGYPRAQASLPVPASGQRIGLRCSRGWRPCCAVLAAAVHPGSGSPYK